MDCTHCLLEGNYEECKKEICGIHNTWYALEQDRTIERLQDTIEKLKSKSVCDCQGCRAIDNLD
jgi:hypothetical protein